MEFTLKQPTKKDADKINQRGKDFNLARAMVMNDALAKQNERDKMAIQSQLMTQGAMTQQLVQAINGKLADVDLRQKLLDNSQKILTQSQSTQLPNYYGMSNMGYPAYPNQAEQYVPSTNPNMYQ